MFDRVLLNARLQMAEENFLIKIKNTDNKYIFVSVSQMGDNCWSLLIERRSNTLIVVNIGKVSPISLELFGRRRWRPEKHHVRPFFIHSSGSDVQGHILHV